MTESMKYYESIRRKYPEAVSKDQFYQIAHISKATATTTPAPSLRASSSSWLIKGNKKKGKANPDGISGRLQE